MKRIAIVVLGSLLAAGCGSDSNSPAVSQVTVTVLLEGAPYVGASVVECASVDSAQSPPAPVGTIATQSTNASGQTTFTVPASTSSGMLCFSVTRSTLGGTSHSDDCKTLNALTSTVTLDLL
jgi:hypothetical protein